MIALSLLIGFSVGQGSFNDCPARVKRGDLVLFQDLHQFAWDWGHSQRNHNQSKGPQLFWNDLLIFNWVKRKGLWDEFADYRWQKALAWNHSSVFQFQRQARMNSDNRAMIVYMGSDDVCSVLEAHWPSYMDNQKVVFVGGFGDGMNFGILNEAYVPHCKLPRPGMKNFFKWLQDPRVIVWATFGASMDHPKIVNLPIGPKMDMARLYALCVNLPTFEQYYNCSLHKATMGRVHKKTKLLIAAFEEYGYRKDVMPFIKRVFNIDNLGVMINVSSVRKRETRIGLMESKFSVSPIGQGDDCYRNFEAIFYGNIPIIEKRALERTYDGLPALAISNYFIDLTDPFLTSKYEKIVCDPDRRDWEKLTIGGWKRWVYEAARKGQPTIRNLALQLTTSGSNQISDVLHGQQNSQEYHHRIRPEWVGPDNNNHHNNTKAHHLIQLQPNYMMNGFTLVGVFFVGVIFTLLCRCRRRC